MVNDCTFPAQIESLIFASANHLRIKNDDFSENKKARTPCGCGLNPIHRIRGDRRKIRESLQERRFTFPISDIHVNNNIKSPQGFRDAGWCLLNPLKLDFYKVEPAYHAPSTTIAQCNR